MDYMFPIIADVHADPERLDGYAYLSTSEWLTLCLAIGTPASLQNLGWPLPDAWNRIGAVGQDIVVTAWRAEG